MSTTESKLRKKFEAAFDRPSNVQWIDGHGYVMEADFITNRGFRFIGAWDGYKAALALPASSGAEPHPDTVLLQEVYDEFDEGPRNGPGHGHSVPGIWDMDNGKKAGKPCRWCATWAKVRASVAQAEAAKGVSHG